MAPLGSECGPMGALWGTMGPHGTSFEHHRWHSASPLPLLETPARIPGSWALGPGGPLARWAQMSHWSLGPGGALGPMGPTLLLGPGPWGGPWPDGPNCPIGPWDLGRHGPNGSCPLQPGLT